MENYRIISLIVSRIKNPDLRKRVYKSADRIFLESGAAKLELIADEEKIEVKCRTAEEVIFPFDGFPQCRGNKSLPEFPIYQTCGRQRIDNREVIGVVIHFAPGVNETKETAANVASDVLDKLLEPRMPGNRIIELQREKRALEMVIERAGKTLKRIGDPENNRGNPTQLEWISTTASINSILRKNLRAVGEFPGNLAGELGFHVPLKRMFTDHLATICEETQNHCRSPHDHFPIFHCAALGAIMASADLVNFSRNPDSTLRWWIEESVQQNKELIFSGMYPVSCPVRDKWRDVFRENIPQLCSTALEFKDIYFPVHYLVSYGLSGMLKAFSLGKTDSGKCIPYIKHYIRLGLLEQL